MLRHNQKGAAIIEFAIVLPLLLLLLFGIIEFSLLMYNKAMITNASREGARRGIVYHVNTTTNPASYTPLQDSQIQTEVTNYLSNHLITLKGISSPTITVAPPDTTPRTSGMLLTVTVSYPYQFLIVPPLAALAGSGVTTIPGTITLSSATQMRME